MNWRDLPPKRWTPEEMVAFRERKGWSRPQLAYHLCAGAASTVYRWEQGLSRPQLHFRRLMSELEEDLDLKEMYEQFQLVRTDLQREDRG
jgi:DNA-binding transcriptional regulator YiaG